ncbi:MAG: hypothetical protein AABW83_04595 [Nanoarchaeota archaeon]
MKKFNLENLEPSRNGIEVRDKSITVHGYSLERGIQTFFDSEEMITDRIRGVNLDNNHYLINEDDINYQKLIDDKKLVCKANKVYIVIKYDEKRKIVYGNEILYEENPKLIDKVLLAIMER